MGGAQSAEPRTVQMDNPNPGVIDLSNDVIDRIKKGFQKQALENASETKTAPPPPPAPKKEPRVVPVTVKPTPTPSPAPVPRAPAAIYQGPAPVYVAPGGMTVTASDMRREKEMALQQNDAMWRQRLAQLEHTLKKTNEIMEREYSTAVEDVRNRFKTASPVHQLPPCQDLKAKVIACYRAHSRETLMCADEVAEFTNCVSMHRLKKLDEEKPVAVLPVTKTPEVKPPKAG